VYGNHLIHPEARHAIFLTLLDVGLVLPVNIFFGIMAAWLLAKYRFFGRKFLITLIELPLSISPIVAGVAYLFVYGLQGYFGEWLREHGIKVMFAFPGIFFVTLFVTSPYIVRELLPLMELQGNEVEEAAISLGAGGWQTFWRVTLPRIRWSLLYGVVLSNARALGEYGAVSVVSGSIRGETNTMTLYIDLLYQDYDAVGAFSVATLLTFTAVVTLIAKTILESKKGEIG
jgi:sulfate transport system permease protein